MGVFAVIGAGFAIRFLITLSTAVAACIESHMRWALNRYCANVPHVHANIGGKER